MSVILTIIFFIFVFIVLSALGLLGVIARLFFRPSQNSANGGSKKSYGDGGRQSSTKWYTYGKKKKKIFDQNDGEYVDFEEIKDNK